MTGKSVPKAIDLTLADTNRVKLTYFDSLVECLLFRFMLFIVLRIVGNEESNFFCKQKTRNQTLRPHNIPHRGEDMHGIRYESNAILIYDVTSQTFFGKVFR